MKLNERVDKLEVALVTHLEESGAIRADLKWLKKAVYFVVGTPLITEVMAHLWK